MALSMLINIIGFFFCWNADFSGFIVFIIIIVRFINKSSLYIILKNKKKHILILLFLRNKVAIGYSHAHISD